MQTTEIKRMNFNQHKIDNCYNYLTELVKTAENKNFSSSKLREKYGLHSSIIMMAKKLGIINYKRAGKFTTYKVLIRNIEPIHARKILEMRYNYSKNHNDKNYKNKLQQQSEIKFNNMDKNEQIIDSTNNGLKLNTIDKYLKFFTTVETLYESDASFNLTSLIEKHRVPDDIMKYAVSSGLVNRESIGKYKFLKKINEQTISDVIIEINRNKSKKLVEYRNNKKINENKDEVKSVNQQPKKAVKSKTEYKIFGVTVMRSETTYIY